MKKQIGKLMRLGRKKSPKDLKKQLRTYDNKISKLTKKKNDKFTGKIKQLEESIGELEKLGGEKAKLIVNTRRRELENVKNKKKEYDAKINEEIKEITDRKIIANKKLNLIAENDKRELQKKQDKYKKRIEKYKELDLKKAIAKGKRTGSLGDKMRLTGLMNTIKGRSLKRRHIRRKLKLDRKDINSLQQLKDIRLTNRNYNEKVDKLAAYSLIKKSQKRSRPRLIARNRKRQYEAIKKQFEKQQDLKPENVNSKQIDTLIDKKLGEFRDSGKVDSLEAKRQALLEKGDSGKESILTKIGLQRSYKERAELKQAKIKELNNLQTNLDKETKESINIDSTKMEKESLKLTNAVLDLKDSTNKFEKASKQKQVLNSLKMKEDMMNEFNTPLNPNTLSGDEKRLRKEIDREAEEAADREIKRSEELSRMGLGQKTIGQMGDKFARARGKEVLTKDERQLRKQAKIKAKERYKDEVKVIFSTTLGDPYYKTQKQVDKERKEKEEKIYQQELGRLRNQQKLKRGAPSVPPPLPSRKQFTQTSG